MISSEDILACLKFPQDPQVLIQTLCDNWSYEDVIEALQVAIERNIIMLNLQGYVVPHDGEFYYA